MQAWFGEHTPHTGLAQMTTGPDMPPPGTAQRAQRAVTRMMTAASITLGLGLVAPAWAIAPTTAVQAPDVELPSAPAPATSAGLNDPLSSASEDTRHTLKWVLESGDNRKMPFAIVDKKAAQIWVLQGDGQLRGASPVLLGLTPGDAGVPGMAQRPVSSLSVQERTTPAGRFAAAPGHNLQGEAIVWFDYAAKLAIHRLRPAPALERRPERLASATPDDNRISLGCVVVPADFYDAVIDPVLGKRYGVVYVLPESQPLQQMLVKLQLSQQ
jgi:hypothetical protein